MRAFIILACVGVVFAGEDMFGMKKMQKTWAEHKAMESCFGENVKDIFAQNEEGSCKVYRDGHARN